VVGGGGGGGGGVGGGGGGGGGGPIKGRVPLVVSLHFRAAHLAVVVPEALQALARDVAHLVCQRFFGIGFSFRGCIGRFVVEKRGYLRADLIAGIEDGDGLVGFAVESDEQMGGDGGVGGFFDFGISGFLRFGFGFGFGFGALIGGRRRVWRRASGRSAASCFGHYGRLNAINSLS